MISTRSGADNDNSFFHSTYSADNYDDANNMTDDDDDNDDDDPTTTTSTDGEQGDEYEGTMLGGLTGLPQMNVKRGITIRRHLVVRTTFSFSFSFLGWDFVDSEIWVCPKSPYHERDVTSTSVFL